MVRQWRDESGKGGKQISFNEHISMRMNEQVDTVGNQGSILLGNSGR